MVFGFCLGEFGCLRQSVMGISVFVIYIYISHYLYIDCIVGILLHSYSTLEETDMDPFFPFKSSWKQPNICLQGWNPCWA